MTNLDKVLNSRDITLQSKLHSVKAMVFPVVKYKCESWTIKKAEHQRIDAFKLMLEKTLESSLESMEIKPVNPKGNQTWIFIGRTEAEAPILWPPDKKSRLIGKDHDAGKDWEQLVKGKEAWHAAIHGVTKSLIWLSDWTTTKQLTRQSSYWCDLSEFHIISRTSVLVTIQYKLRKCIACLIILLL